MSSEPSKLINKVIKDIFLIAIIPYGIIAGLLLKYYIQVTDDNFLASFAALFLTFLIITLIATAVAFFKITGPLKTLAVTAREISKGNTDIKILPTRDDEIGEMQKSLLTLSKLYVEKQKMKSTFSKYMSDLIADEILTEELEGRFLAEYRNVTILFSDIRGFTTFSEKLEPRELLDILNNYFDQMINIIMKNGGVINKFIGDAMMVLYNAPNLCEYSEIKAIISAIEMNGKLREFNSKYTQKYGFNLEIGTGINSGQVVSGNVGSEKRMEYTVIGDNVNISSRLQSVAKGGEIIISEPVYKFAKYVFKFKDMGEIELKGKKQPLRLYKFDGNLDYDTIKNNLKNGLPDVGQLSMIALGRLDKLSLELDLMPELKNQNEKIRIMALDLIIERYKNKAEECIMYILQNDKSDFVKIYAINKLGDPGYARFINFLAHEYLNTDNLRLRGATIECLHKLKDDKLKERVLKTCKFETAEITKEIENVFAKYSKLNLYETIETLISDESSVHEKKIGAYVLCNLGLYMKVDILNKLFKDGNDELRKIVVSAFLKIGTCKTVIFLLKNLNKFEKDTLNNAYKVIANLIGKYYGDEYKYDFAVQMQLDIIKSLILSSDGKNYEKLKVALIKNK